MAGKTQRSQSCDLNLMGGISGTNNISMCGSAAFGEAGFAKETEMIGGHGAAQSLMSMMPKALFCSMQFNCRGPL